MVGIVRLPASLHTDNLSTAFPLLVQSHQTILQSANITDLPRSAFYRGREDKIPSIPTK